MCDEYDDERMRVLWRALAEQKERSLSRDETPEEPQIGVSVLNVDAPASKARPRALVR